jgi:hypothetical protein
MNNSFGPKSRSGFKRKNMLRGTPTPASRSGLRGGRIPSPAKYKNAGEFKRAHGIGQDFEKKATEFFTSK